MKEPARRSGNPNGLREDKPLHQARWRRIDGSDGKYNPGGQLDIKLSRIIRLFNLLRGIGITGIISIIRLFILLRSISITGIISIIRLFILLRSISITGIIRHFGGLGRNLRSWLGTDRLDAGGVGGGEEVSVGELGRGGLGLRRRL
ncbi:hypothetical protein PAPYR_10598 [Paratrimastix pyriformis]|uniref:Uncharacterized protein n=1 Tax=Paratrimastix pyriformis TaxID=342808 RepID=A0ABQ8U9C7_9EUKA|nr:hypothetical protein PAPYR_10598 [Paratrimastix pyriformis]